MITLDLLWVPIAGCALIGFLCGVMGNLLTIRRLSLWGDVIGHSLLPGIVLGFLVAGLERHQGWMSLGALLSAIAASYTVEKLSKPRADAAMAIVLAGFYSLGIMLLVWVSQNFSQGAKSGLDKLLLGQASAIGSTEVTTIGIGGGLAVLMLIKCFPALRAFCFDPNHFLNIPKTRQALRLICNTLIAIVVILAIQAVGVILVSALLVIPAASAMVFCKTLSNRMALAGVLGALAGVMGAVASSWQPGLPTGAAIVLASGILFVLIRGVQPR